jgi:hypothetical protein
MPAYQGIKFSGLLILEQPGLQQEAPEHRLLRVEITGNLSLLQPMLPLYSDLLITGLLGAILRVPEIGEESRVAIQGMSLLHAQQAGSSRRLTADLSGQ